MTVKDGSKARDFDNALAYCRAKVGAAGTSFYYCTLYSANDARAALLALEAFRAEVDEIPSECQDASIARLKLAWWQDEIARVFDDKAAHPIARLLQELVARIGIDREELTAPIELTATRIAAEPAISIEELERRLEPRMRFERALAKALGAPADSARSDALARAFGFTDVVLAFARNPARRCIDIPRSMLDAAGIDGAALSRGEKPDQIGRLVAELAIAAQSRIADAEARASPTGGRALLPRLIALQIDRKRLTRLAKGGARAIGRENELTPLHKLLIAWKTKRANP